MMRRQLTDGNRMGGGYRQLAKAGLQCRATDGIRRQIRFRHVNVELGLHG
jgi:hypothetical protein